MTYKDQLAGATVAQLRINAAAAGIVGRSKMNKAELVEAVATAWADVVEFAHADAIVLNEKHPKCLLHHGYVKPCQQDRGHAGECDKETVGLVRTTGRAAVTTNGGTVRPVLAEQLQDASSIPANLCGHGIALGRCSICREDAALGPVEETEHLRVVRSRASLMCAKSFHDSNGDRGICAVRQEPGARGNHEGPHYDDQRKLWSDYTLPGDRRPRCGVEMPALPGMSTFTGPTRICNLILNADGECPDANHRPAGVAINFQPEQFVAQQMRGRLLRDAPIGGELRCALQADVQASGSINAKLIRDREDAQRKLHELRCAIAELVGRWQADSSAQARLFGNVLESLLQEHR